MLHKLASILLSLCFLTAGVCHAAQMSDLPAKSIKIPPMVPEKSVSLYLPSGSAPGSGIAVNVIYPEKPRYEDGAPVVVVVPGGHGPSGINKSTHASQSGFAEVRFAFPGGGHKKFRSSGIHDNRGINSQACLKDVLLFAAGKLADRNGRKINDIVPVKLYNSKIGILGWSNGGNTALVTLAKNAADLSFVGWIAFYEAPVGALFYPPALGGKDDLILNRHYRQGSAATGECLVDFRKLAWQNDGSKSPGAHKKVGEPEISGVLFYDENGNKRWEESFEYAFTYSTHIGLDKQIYAPEIVLAMLKKKVCPYRVWQSRVAYINEVQAFFKERDGSLYVKDLVKAMPDLLITVFGSRLDHLQRQPDHPHICLLYNLWLASKAKWVRLNPSPIYAGALADMNPHTFVNNKPNASIDAAEIARFLEPEGVVPDYVFMEAAISELSDRLREGKLEPALEKPLVEYDSGAKASEDKDKEES